MRVDDAFNHKRDQHLPIFVWRERLEQPQLPGKSLESLCWLVARFSYQSVGETIRRLGDLRWDGSLERRAWRFAAVLAKGDPPPETDLVSIFMSRILFRLVRLVRHQHFDTWIAAKEALHQALAPEECARELWLVDAPLELVRKEKATTSFLQQPRLHGQAHKPQHTFTGRSQPGTAALSKSRQCAADSKMQSLSADASQSEETHSKDCKHQLMGNQQANHAGRSTIPSAVRAVHLRLNQQTVSQPSDSLPLRWRNVHQNVPLVFLAQAPHEARLAGLRVNLMGQEILLLLDTGATHSFASPRLVDELQLRTKFPQESTYLTLVMATPLARVAVRERAARIFLGVRACVAPTCTVTCAAYGRPRGFGAFPTQSRELVLLKPCLSLNLRDRVFARACCVAVDSLFHPLRSPAWGADLSLEIWQSLNVDEDHPFDDCSLSTPC
ncbi:hypothetical protein Esti_005837 [Eimeria stiedai]